MILLGVYVHKLHLRVHISVICCDRCQILKLTSIFFSVFSNYELTYVCIFRDFHPSFSPSLFTFLFHLLNSNSPDIPIKYSDTQRSSYFPLLISSVHSISRHWNFRSFDSITHSQELYAVVLYLHTFVHKFSCIQRKKYFISRVTEQCL